MATVTEIVRTDFAPATRSSPEELAAQSKEVGLAAFFRELLNAVPEILMVLNENRQLVFANAAFCQFLGADDASPLLGQRPGELVGCMHATDNPGGCGTGPSCRKCGAVLAILSAQRGEACVRECRIALAEGGGGLELKVAATPVTIAGRVYTVFSATDISGDKRRQVLEQLMFKNISHGLEGLHDALVTESVSGNGSPLAATTGQLLGAITTHRLLAAAEGGRLRPRPVAVNSADLLREIARHAVEIVGDKGIEIRVDRGGGDPTVAVDRTLIKQVLAALVTNAVEASLPGERVTIAAAAEDERLTLSVHNPQEIDVDTQLQLFQRGFTTKGEGRGLGLYGARLMTERYLQGQIDFVSDAERGTMFHVVLPAAGEAIP